ncbi:MAG: mannose-phosphate guanylyltransferase/mannose-6-phosphate isomerase [Rickettsiaceae bacterium]|jgi:mannose-1-phosphate guanylyltransferase/mannose-6-phosphate isomerase|nr:mannose-phosphate guanylyltransferase/mannose-6-phosphate isomerase [Rickettsiaceae bacterium]
MKIKPVILAGGLGTRLWPFSNEKHPKQFLKIFSNKSLFQLTLERHKGIYFGTPLIIIGEEHRFIAAEQLREINIDAEIIVEPVQKNTAPCALVAALKYENLEGMLALIPADHLIEDIDSYKASLLKLAANAVRYDYIFTLGIEPKEPHTGYGYLAAGKHLGEDLFKIKSFVEKPNLELAREYLNKNNYFWNSGILLFRPKVLIDEARILEKSMHDAVVEALQKARLDKDFIWLNREVYSQINANSIDHAILERTFKLAVVKASFDWKDLGNWNSLWQVSSKDENNNAIFGNIVLEGVKNSYISTANKLTAVLGVDDLIIVNTDEITLIAHKNKTEDIKLIVEKLGKRYS